MVEDESQDEGQDEEEEEITLKQKWTDVVEDESQDEGQDEEEEELTDDPRYWCEAEWYPNPIADLLPGFYDNQTEGEAKLLETI